jgi:hypothetical protein
LNDYSVLSSKGICRFVLSFFFIAFYRKFYKIKEGSARGFGIEAKPEN